MRLPLHAFGEGATRPFQWYLDGPSRVTVNSIEDVLSWLMDCQYVTDVELFRERDFWQHPATFEQLRRGDCEDHALWAWARLVALGIDAEFVCGGTRRLGTIRPGGHAWVTYRKDREIYLLESVAKAPEQILRPLSEVKDYYVPQCSVNAGLTTFAYGGLIARARYRRRRRPPDA